MLGRIQKKVDARINLSVMSTCVHVDKEIISILIPNKVYCKMH